MTGVVVYERINNANDSVIYEQKKYLYGKLRRMFEDVREKNYALKRKSMNCLREKVTKNERASSVLSMTSRQIKNTIICTITTTATNESQPKSILKTKQSSLTNKSSRVISAPANGQRIHRKKQSNNSIPPIEISPSNEQLSKSNRYSYTQICSSSQHSIENTDQSSRQLVLNTIMSHLHLHTPTDLSKWNLYHEFDHKISSSLSPTVYRNYERIIL